MELENWAVEKLSVFLGFDSETLKTQVLPYLMSFTSAEDLTEHLTDMLGTSADSLSFIQEFAVRRFSSSRVQKKETGKKPPVTSTARETPGQFPSLPKSSTSSDTQWPSNINVYMKNTTTDDEYFTSTRKSKKSYKAPKAQNDSSSTSQSNLTSAHASKQTQSTLTSDRLEKKPKKKSEMTLEAALKELDITATEGKGKRKTCQCQATKHPLLTIAPNCLNCGKIICTLEGVGPCTFCKTPVLSKEQQVLLIAEAKKKRSEQKQKQQQQRRPKVAATPAVGYASKVSGDFSSRHFESVWDEEQEDDSRRRAEEHKEKLLEFQRTSAKRSTVIDQATDFTLPTDTSNPWLSPQERALQMKKQQANLRRLETEGRSRHRVMTIDVQTRQVKVEEASPESESEEEIIPVVNEKRNEASGSAGTYANNPLLKNLQGPKFMGAKGKNTKARSRKMGRVQYDDNFMDLTYASSVADERDIAVEPVSCRAN
ncbi:hypothetical protein DFQ28_008323 [Apophysomyces sp. BC1034]|nr:hypothetical protein DFQ30_010713 [Apophysomyces sp. BC1015]KAG0181329.1 hypothetical protein DFQ29_008689 [Apophysomyces sp. BC1021]KAG0186110.1 hypothetical protein DFQ28_008323 [Apophysomyces sp. BC1034]